MNNEQTSNVSFKYYLLSGNTEMEGDRFVNRFNVEIVTNLFDEKGDSQLVGYAKFSQILIDYMHSKGIPVIEVVDSISERHLELVSGLYDFENCQFHESIVGDDYAGSNDICFIEIIALKSQFQKLGIGKNLIADIILRFSSYGGLVALYADPMQYLEYYDWDFDDEFSKSVIKDLPEKTVESIRKLYIYFSSLGFVNKVQDQRIFHMDMTRKNKRIEDEIDKIGSW